VTFGDADGGLSAARFDGQFRVGTTPSMRVGDLPIMPSAGFATNFALDQPSDYAARLEVDGARAGTLAVPRRAGT